MRQTKELTVFLTDSGDNVTASTPGDSIVVLRHLVEQKVRSAVVAGITDPAAVQRRFAAGEGQTVRLAIGSTVDKRFGPPLEAEAQVVRLVKDPRWAVIRVGSVEAILSDQPEGFTEVGDFRNCGIDPLARQIVVVKQGYLFPSLREIAPRHIMLLTPGAGDMRLDRLTYTRRRRPVFPFEPQTTFHPESALAAGSD